MSIFNWTAPVFKLAGLRWSEDSLNTIGEWLRPFVPTGGLFMDLGGGTGDLGAGVARALGASVIVVDPTPQMLARVPARPRVSVSLSAAESLPFPDAYFDAVLCSDAFHHFRGPDAAIAEIRRTVRPRGGVVMLEFDRGGLGRLVASTERLLGEPGVFWSPVELQGYLAARGVVGTVTRGRGITYLFQGEVEVGAARDHQTSE
jgi:demethylmenaquinone methyltransferase/2-methoxy-6-polyprenyl-1,4-benzoquinol methylase